MCIHTHLYIQAHPCHMYTIGGNSHRCEDQDTDAPCLIMAWVPIILSKTENILSQNAFNTPNLRNIKLSLAYLKCAQSTLNGSWATILRKRWEDPWQDEKTQNNIQSTLATQHTAGCWLFTLVILDLIWRCSSLPSILGEYCTHIASPGKDQNSKYPFCWMNMAFSPLWSWKIGKSNHC